MRGAARKTRGRKPGDPLTVRSEPVRCMLRAGEFDDLAAIADGWGVPVGTAGWALIADALAKIRGSRADLAEVGIAVAAARRIRVDEPGCLEPAPGRGRKVLGLEANVELEVRGAHLAKLDGAD